VTRETGYWDPGSLGIIFDTRKKSSLVPTSTLPSYSAFCWIRSSLSASVDVIQFQIAEAHLSLNPTAVKYN
jgi:hypothetical protein